MNYKKGLILVVTAVVVLLSGFSPTLAHVLVIDGQIGAVLHVNPDDNPIAGQVSDMYFEFKDTDQKLQLKNCDCSITVEEGGTTVFSKQVGPSDISGNNLSFSYTFTAKGIYTILVKGQPNSSVIATDQFKPFSLRYDIRVDRLADGFVATSTPTQASTTGFSLGYFFSEHGFHILIFGAAFVIGIVLTIVDRNKNKVKK